MKVLLLLDGITTSSYIKSSLMKSNFPHTDYDLVRVFDSEGILDDSAYLNNLEWMDKQGDWLQCLAEKNTRNLIRTKLKYLVNILKEKGALVDIFAHSLGAWLLNGTDIEVNNVILAGNPQYSKWFGRLIHSIDEYSYGVQSKRKIILWSNQDFLSNSKYLLKKREFGRHIYNTFNTNASHEVLDYLNYHNTTGWRTILKCEQQKLNSFYSI